MGVYTISCPICQVKYQWFSGSKDRDQRCDDCKKPKKNNMTNPTLEEQLIDTLKSAIAAKDLLIDFLMREIQRLQSSQTPTNPFSDPDTLKIQPQPAYPPGYQGIPYQPQYQPGQINPLAPPWTITSGEIPPVLSPCTTHDMVKWGDQKSGGENCRKCGFGSGWLVSHNGDITNRTITTGHIDLANSSFNHTVASSRLEGGFDGLLK
jgi:hypothetical protein